MNGHWAAGFLMRLQHERVRRRLALPGTHVLPSLIFGSGHFLLMLRSQVLGASSSSHGHLPHLSAGLQTSFHGQFRACFKDREEPGRQVKCACWEEDKEDVVHLPPPPYTRQVKIIGGQ